MIRILVIGTNAEDIAAWLEVLGLSAIRTTAAFRDLALSMPVMDVHMPHLPPAPKFGGDRPYLKKKKGRS